MHIRPERPTDPAAIYAVHAASFPSEAEASLVDALRQAGRLSISVVAETEGLVVGHIAFSPVRVASGAVGAGLAPLAVIPAQRRMGIGARLVAEVLATCRAQGFGWAVVLGDPHYYGRFGFFAAAQVGLHDEYGGGAAFQAIELLPHALPRNAGLVRYAPEFAAVA